jgi:single-strand DNA-binding protein
MNNITIAGQLGRDAEVRQMPNGEPVANFSVADSQGREKPTIWWNCQLFGKRAESLAQYLTKGTSVTVSGNVTQRSYTDKNGVEKVSTEIRVADVALQGSKKDDAPAFKKPSQDAAKARQAPKASSGFDDMDDSIPF